LSGILVKRTAAVLIIN